MLRVADIRDAFVTSLHENCFTTDRTGARTIELFGASFLADEPFIFGEINQAYVRAEIDWYESQSMNVNDIKTESGNVPEAWKRTATPHGEINSNYGALIYSSLYHEQYKHALHDLYSNPDTRRASMIYTRPSMWVEYNRGGRSDFCCTNSVTYYARQGVDTDTRAIHAVVQMRSNDAWAGYRNDYAWQQYVLRKLTNDLNSLAGDERYVEGNIIWQVQNLHTYSKDFWRIEGYDRTGNPMLTKAEYEALGDK